MTLFNIPWTWKLLRDRLCLSVLLSLSALLLLNSVEAKELIGDRNDGSRANPVHNIALLDENGDKISADDDPMLPFSTAQTCGQCHDYDKISQGFHFNATVANSPAGRAAEPWIYVDAKIGMQIPVSYRDWAGTFRPDEIGLSRWQMLKTFGKFMPGGMSENLDSPDLDARWEVSGETEINCMSCHSGSASHDQAEYASQIDRENFRWAASASCGFASVKGSAKDMPDTFDPLMPPMLDDPTLVAPSIEYHKNAFSDKKVFFNINGKPSANRCYFCHSTDILDKNSEEKKVSGKDVHLAAGLTCVDCHQGGLDHKISHGYEKAKDDPNNKTSSVLTCKGCHIRDGAETPAAGNFGAPEPKHLGIAPVHFERLSCTACHSGPRPGEKPFRVKTSRAHGLGTHNVNTSYEALPHIQSPVFVKGADGKIGPYNIIWPAFWGSLVDGEVKPLSSKVVKKIAGKAFKGVKLKRYGDWSKLTNEQVLTALKLLGGSKSVKGKAVYVAGGKLYELDEKEEALKESEHEAGKAYAWPVAHDVRPVAQSLGVRGCDDCHSTDSPFFFSSVPVDTPLANAKPVVKAMTDFEGIDGAYARAFAMSFVFRPWLKVVSFAVCAVIGIILLLYLLKAFGCVLRIVAGSEDK